ncbi:hypothetical protein [Dictyobacter halimunensis]
MSPTVHPFGTWREEMLGEIGSLIELVVCQLRGMVSVACVDKAVFIAAPLFFHVLPHFRTIDRLRG